MTQSGQQLFHDIPLGQLVSKAISELRQLGYCKRTINRYRFVWKQLVTFSHSNGLGDTFSGHLATQFIEANQLKEGYLPGLHMSWQRHVPFITSVLEDFAQYGRIKRYVTDMQQIQVSQSMKKPLHDYEQYCKTRRHHRPTTLRANVRDIMIFLDFLGARNVNTLDQMTALDLTDFMATRDHYTPRTVSRLASALRLFLQYLFMQGILSNDLSQDLPVIRVSIDASIPSVWDPQLITKLLNAVDRSSPRGKRDYAILLLACRLGLRVGDIRTLMLDNLNWEAACIEIMQSKTGTPLTLPMTEEVGSALISYLKSARPKSQYREVFLKLRAPFEPFPEGNHLHTVVSHWRQVAGISFRSVQHCGLHSLRHSCASQLLHEGTPLQTISNILGHASVNTTRIYAKTDVDGLRSVAVDPEEVRDVD